MIESFVNAYNTLLDFLDNHVLIASLILFAALTNAMIQLKKARGESKVFGFIDFLIELIAAIFAGIVSVLFAVQYNATPVELGIAAGCGAFLGIRGLNAFGDLILRHYTNKIEK